MSTSIRLPKDLELKLSALVKVTGKTKSRFIIEALTEHIADLEDYLVAAKRMRDYDPSESVSLKDLKARYEMED
jgi:RHH-type rel operon transcriptional repressor/antitoxin RelB